MKAFLLILCAVLLISGCSANGSRNNNSPTGVLVAPTGSVLSTSEFFSNLQSYSNQTISLDGWVIAANQISAAQACPEEVPFFSAVTAELAVKVADGINLKLCDESMKTLECTGNNCGLNCGSLVQDAYNIMKIKVPPNYDPSKCLVFMGSVS